jgi:hypothetical protein
MNITPLYKNVNGIFVLTVCMLPNWRECEYHKNCTLVPVTVLKLKSEEQELMIEQYQEWN